MVGWSDVADAVKSAFSIGKEVDPNEVYAVPKDEQLDVDIPHSTEMFGVPPDLDDVIEGEVFFFGED